MKNESLSNMEPDTASRIYTELLKIQENTKLKSIVITFK